MYKYYVGYKGFIRGLLRAWIFRSTIEPTTENHPADVLFCWGGYSTRQRAEQVAMYQNYYIENERTEHIPLWQ